jgi:hypothetical protein
MNDRFLEILDLTRFLKSNLQGMSKIIEGPEAIGMPSRMQSEGLAIVGDHVLKILHLACLLKTCIYGICQIVEARGSIGMPRGTPSESGTPCEYCFIRRP